MEVASLVWYCYGQTFYDGMIATSLNLWSVINLYKKQQPITTHNVQQKTSTTKRWRLTYTYLHERKKEAAWTTQKIQQNNNNNNNNNNNIKDIPRQQTVNTKESNVVCHHSFINYLLLWINKSRQTRDWTVKEIAHVKKNILEHKKHKNEYRHTSLKYKTWTSRLTLNSNYWITFY